MRGLFSRIAAPVTRSSAGVPSYGMIPPLGSVQSAAGLLVSQATAMTVSAVYGAVTTRAEDVARCVPSLFSIDAPEADAAGIGHNGGPPLQEPTRRKVTDHPIAKLLKRPNRVQTWFEFMRDLWIGRLLRGNGYAVVLRDDRGQPQEMLLINPDAVMVLEASDGSWFYNVNRLGLFQIAVLRGFPTAIPAEDVMHFRGPSFNMLVGASTIGLARDQIGLAQAQSQQMARWMANGARPSVILETDRQLTEPVAKRLKANWQEFTAGILNVGKTAILEEGLKAKALALTSTDLQFIENCNFTVQDVARFYKMPTRKLMQPDTTRGSTIIQEDQAYVNGTVSPDLESIEQKFEMFFDLDREGLELDMDETPLLRADPLTRYNLGRIGVLSGLLRPNEWRRGERLPPVPGGDEVIRPLNMAALGSDLTGTAPDDAGRPAEGEATPPGVPNKKLPKKSNGAAGDAAPEG